MPSSKGTIELTSSPSGAEVYLDNQYKGSTPVTIQDVQAGDHVIEVRLKGYDTWTSSGTINGGERVILSAALTPATLSPNPSLVSVPSAIPSASQNSAGEVQRTKSVAATARQVGNSIVITWQGGIDNPSVTSYRVNINDAATWFSGYQPIVGGSNSFSAGSSGPNHVVVVASFDDGSQQVVLDTYVSVPSTAVTTVPYTTVTTVPYTTVPYSGVQRTKSVAATARQVGNSIVVTWQGGIDNPSVTSYRVNINDAATWYSGFQPIVGGSNSFSAGSSGPNHVVVVASFNDGSQQVVLDTYVSAPSTTVTTVPTTIPTMVPPSFWIHIDPIGDKYTRDIVTISGTTNLNPGHAVAIRIYPASSPDIPVATITTYVQQGDTYNTFQWAFDTSTFTPGYYIVIAGDITIVTDSTGFNLIYKSYSVAAVTRQLGNNISVTWAGGSDNAYVISWTATVRDQFTNPGQPPTVGYTSTFTGVGTAGMDHVTVGAYFKDGSSGLILDTYV